jgi:hypothetical protein
VLLLRNLELRTGIRRSILFRLMWHNHWVRYLTTFFIFLDNEKFINPTLAFMDATTI